MALDSFKKSSSTWGDAHLISLVVNILVLTTLSISILTNLEDASMFSFGWTYRLNINDVNVDMKAAKDAIVTKYTDNKDSGLPNLGTMLDDIYGLTRCRPALYDGGLEWDAGEMSPTCNCVRNMHVQYVKSVRPNGVGLDVTEMNSADTKNKTKTVVDSIILKCFTAVRHTQVDDMVDPLHPDKRHTLHQTNIVVNVLYWNIMGCILSMCILSLHMMHERVSANITASRNMVSDYGMLLGCCILIMWNVVVPFLVVTPLYAFGLLFFALVYMGYCLYHMWSESKNISVSKGLYPARKSQVFWINYTLVIPFVAQSMNMLLQRRDIMLNWVVFWGAVVIGLCNMGIDMVQTSFNYTSLVADGNTHADKEIIRSFMSKKNYIIRMVTLCIALLLLTACMGSFPVFPWVPFSNMYSGMVIVTIIIILPMLSSGRHLVQEDKVAATKGSNTWIMDLSNVEMAARLIFTAAALCDIWSIKMVDNISTSF